MARKNSTTIVPPPQAARRAALSYTCDDTPGLRRTGRARRFRYLACNGRPVRDAETLQRIRALAIPPAWKEVWISPYHNSHLQATGRDARGRKQYRYHPRWRRFRDEAKYGRLLAFARQLPALTTRINADLAQPGLSREKVIAAVVRLLQRTLVRVGNEEYAAANGSFGLTTLRDRHASVRGTEVRLRFRGKGGLFHQVSLQSPRLAPIVKRCQDLPGQQLFQYVDASGTIRSVASHDVNSYLAAVMGEAFTAKDFRTWAGTVLTVRALTGLPPFKSEREAKRNIGMAMEAAAQGLGNTPAICRKCYVHPAVIEYYLAGKMPRMRTSRTARSKRDRALQHAEAVTLRLLENAKRRARPRHGSRSRPGRSAPAQLFAPAGIAPRRPVAHGQAQPSDRTSLGNRRSVAGTPARIAAKRAR